MVTREVFFRRWMQATWLFLLFVILWGAFVRATGSGAGCGAHWPTCNGEIVPRAPTVQTFIEYTHRITSGLSGLLVLAACVGSFFVFPKKHPVRAWSVAMWVFLVLEAAIGAGIVKFEWVAHQVSVSRALSMAMHLVNTFFLLLAATAVVFFSRNTTPVESARGRAELLASMVGLLVTGISGTVAALGDTLLFVSVPQGMVQESDVLLQTLLKLRIWHPLLALGLAGVMLWTASVLYREKALVRLAGALGGLVVAQLGLGLLNVVWKAPVALQLVHLLLADILWTVCVWGLLSVWKRAPAQASSDERTLSHVAMG